MHKITTFYQSKESDIFAEFDLVLKDVAALQADLDSVQEARDDSSSPVARRRSLSGTKLRQGSIFGEWGFPGIRRRPSISRRTLDRIDSDDSDEEQDERSKLRKTGTSDSARSMTMHDSTILDSARLRRRTSAGLDEMSDGNVPGGANPAIFGKKRMISIYVSLCELKSFVQLNKTGFGKVLKKYDKTLDRNLKNKYIQSNITNSSTFKPEVLDGISEKVSLIEEAYANLITQGDLDQAKRELRLDLREHVVWERNTVWREMIGIERKAQAANLGVRQTILGGDPDPHKRHRQGDEEPETTKEVDTPVGRCRCPRFMLNPTFYILIATLITFGLLLVLPIMELREQQNCLALVVFVSLLWATEVSEQFLLPDLVDKFRPSHSS